MCGKVSCIVDDLAVRSRQEVKALWVEVVALRLGRPVEPGDLATILRQERRAASQAAGAAVPLSEEEERVDLFGLYLCDSYRERCAREEQALEETALEQLREMRLAIDADREPGTRGMRG